MISKFNDLLNYLFDSYKKSSIDNILHIDTTTFTKPLEIKINYHTSRYVSNSMEIEEFYRHYNKSMLKKDIEYCIRLISYKKYIANCTCISLKHLKLYLKILSKR